MLRGRDPTLPRSRCCCRGEPPIDDRATDWASPSSALPEGGRAYRFRAGKLSPVFFGSALTNFGIEPFLDRFLALAPAPLGRQTVANGIVEPDSEQFSGFVFKIQANMDPQHRDRIAFLRVCSGRFVRGMDAVHVRSGKPISLNKSLQLRAQERTIIEEAYAGDIVGLWDPGVLRIGDTIAEEGESGKTFFVIETGVVRVSVHGRDVGQLGPGEAFGEMALIDKSARSATVKAETDVHGYQLPVWSFRPIVESHPEMVWALLESLAQRVREAEGRSAAEGS